MHRVYGIVAKQSLTKWQIDCSLLQKRYDGNMPTIEISGGEHQTPFNPNVVKIEQKLLALAI